MFLLVTPAGHKWWRLKYRFAGKEKLLSLGVYPDVPLAGRKDKKSELWIEGAREKCEQARMLLANGIDPGAVRKAEKAANAAAGQNTFEAVAREWHAKAVGWVGAEHGSGKLHRLEVDIFPTVGASPISELRAPDLLRVLRKVESRGALELARRARQLMGQVFRYAIATGRADRNPAADLREAIPPANPTHHAAVTEPKAVGALMRAINGYEGEAVTCAALRLAPLLFVRPGELRAAEWTEFDLEEAIWRIPAERMKMRADHIVPLSTQAVSILEGLQALSGSGKLVFPVFAARPAR